MAKVNALVNSFTSGELSPRMAGRVDTTKFRSGLSTCQNFIVMPHGGVRKRGGTQFVAPLKQGNTARRSIEFSYNIEESYVIEMGVAGGSGYMRFFTAGGGILTNTETTITAATKANPCVITAASHGLSNGDWVFVTGVGGMTQLNNRHFQVAGATANTFQLSGVNSAAYDTFTSGGTVQRIVEVAHSYTGSELGDLSFAQSADTLYIAHEAHHLAKLERLSATSWVLSDVDISNGPFRRINTNSDNTIKPTVVALTGNITGATQANPVVVTVDAAHGLTDGATVTIASVSGMTEINGTFEIRSLTSTTFYLCDARGVPVDGTGFTAYTSGGTWTQSVTRWGTFSPGTTVTLTAFEAAFTSENVGALWRLWEPGKGTGIAQPFATKAVTNTSVYTKDSKVYGVINLAHATVWYEEWQYPDHESGWVHVQDDLDYYAFDSVYLHDITCTVEITSYTSATAVTARIVRNHMPKSCISYGTAFWDEGAWSDRRGHPSLIAFHEQRLWAVGNTAEPQTIWASRAGSFEDFLDGADDDRAVVYKIASDRVETPIWLLAGKVLTLGTASGEYSITAGGGQDAALTPSNARITRQTTWGSASAGAIRIGNVAMFVQRDGVAGAGGRRVREFGYQFETDSFAATDMTILSEHLGWTQFDTIVYQQDPDPVVWVSRRNGTLIGMTYEKEQQVLAWHRHSIGGDGLISDTACIPGASGDELWCIMEREIDGATVYYHEILTNGRIDVLAKEDSKYLDAHLTYDGAATDTVSGLWHLEGETVSVLADGAVHPAVTVSDGRITLEYEASTICIGYGYTSTLTTMDLEAGAQAGTAHGRPKRVSQCVLRFHRSLGGSCGPSSTSMDVIPFRTSHLPMGESPPLFSGFKTVDFPGGWGQEARIRFEHSDPLPCNLLSITVEMNVTG